MPNMRVVRSDRLASVSTECPARVRLLGASQSVDLNGVAFIAVAGNGLSVSELFRAWWHVHQGRPVKALHLAEAVRVLIDPSVPRAAIHREPAAR